MDSCDSKKDKPKYRWHAFYVCKTESFFCCNYQSINDELNKHKECPKCHTINYPEDQKMQPKCWHAFYACEREMRGSSKKLLCYKYQFINDDPNESKPCPKCGIENYPNDQNLLRE